jgi:YidC/Oxa1 family membrane protein insertase
MFGDNFGLSVIALTVLVKTIMLPLIVPSLKSVKKMQALKPKLDALKKKYTDPKELQQAQLELYKTEGINPAAGCLPQILQIIVLIALYQVFMKFIEADSVDGQALNTGFLFWDLSQSDKTYILPLISGATQFVFSLMLQPGVQSEIENPKNKEAKQKEEDKLEMAQSIQQQMVYMMPLMTVVISINFPSGLVLYWIVSTVYSVIQQAIFSGWGGLVPFFAKITQFVSTINQKKNG